MSPTLGALLAVLVAAGVPAAVPTISPLQAQAMATKLAAIEIPAQPGRPARRAAVAVSEGEVSSYLNLTRGGEMPDGLSNLIVRFEGDRLRARGVLDLDRLRRRAPLPRSLEKLLRPVSGQVPVEVAGRLRVVSAGLGAIAVDEAYVARIPIAVPLFERLAIWATRSPERPQGCDLRAPFHFPRPVRRVRLEPGRAVLD